MLYPALIQRAHSYTWVPLTLCLLPFTVLCARNEIPHDEMYVWCDFHSIPQENIHMQRVSIMALALYASIARYFIIVAPPTKHADTNKECNLHTYGRCAWIACSAVEAVCERSACCSVREGCAFL